MAWLDIGYWRKIMQTSELIWNGWMDCRNADDMREKGKAHYIAHYKMVRELTPPDQLLEYKLSDGWGPLCQHLGKPIPLEPFPFLNEAAWFDEMIAILLRVRLLRFLRNFTNYVGPVLLILAAIWLGIR